MNARPMSSRAQRRTCFSEWREQILRSLRSVRTTSSYQRPHMPHARLAEPVGLIPPLERADDASPAPLLGARDHLAREPLDVVHLEGEAAERVAGGGVEAGRNHDEVRGESPRRGGAR